MPMERVGTGGLIQTLTRGGHCHLGVRVSGPMRAVDGVVAGLDTVSLEDA